MAILDSVDWDSVRAAYEDRVSVSGTLLQLYNQRSVEKFANLALGVSNPDGNYSAAEHNLGPKILYYNKNAAQRVYDLAGDFISLTSARCVPDLIRKRDLKYLKIGVGSEISCMMNPKICWVANTRTIWTHLVIKHADNIKKADEELKLYREADESSEMYYPIWTAIHAELAVALTRVAELGRDSANKMKVTPGGIIYIWADAIASALYSKHHG